MLTLLFRQLRFEALRGIFTVLAIAAVIAEILILEGFLAGLYSQLRDAVIMRGGDLIVSQAGVSNFIAARSILPQSARLDAESVDGVRTAHPLTGISAIYEQAGARTPIFLLVHDTMGGPANVIAGERKGRDHGIVIDRAIAIEHDLGIGDSITISAFDFEVTGISRNSIAFMTPFAFISYDDLIDFYFESDVAADIATFPLLSFLLIETEEGANDELVAARLESRLPEADVHFPADLAESDEMLGRKMIGPILNLLLVVSYGIGVLVVGLFMFIAVRGRLRDLGVLRALGFRVRALAAAAVGEAVLLSLLALPIGIFLADGLAGVIEASAPIYTVLSTEPGGIVRTVIATFSFAAIGALVPVRTIARIDAAAAFRS